MLFRVLSSEFRVGKRDSLWISDFELTLIQLTLS